MSDGGLRVRRGRRREKGTVTFFLSRSRSGTGRNGDPFVLRERREAHGVLCRYRYVSWIRPRRVPPSVPRWLRSGYRHIREPVFHRNARRSNSGCSGSPFRPLPSDECASNDARSSRVIRNDGRAVNHFSGQVGQMSAEWFRSIEALEISGFNVGDAGFRGLP